MRALLLVAVAGILFWLLYAGWPRSSSDAAVSENVKPVAQRAVKVDASIAPTQKLPSTQQNQLSNIPLVHREIEVNKNKVLLLVEKMASDERTRIRVKRVQTITDANGLTRTFNECIIDAPNSEFRANVELELTEISQQSPTLKTEIDNWRLRYLNFKNKYRVVSLQSQIIFPDGNMGVDFVCYNDTDYITEKELVSGKFLYRGGSSNSMGSRHDGQLLAERWLDLWK
jgi:hypothetical protein